MSADKRVIPEHVRMYGVVGDLTVGADDVSNDLPGGGTSRRSARRRRAMLRRQVAARVRHAAIKATQNPKPQAVSASAAGAQSALARALAQAEQWQGDPVDCHGQAVVWRYLSADAKPLDQWATRRRIATDSHFTPFCQPEADEDLWDELDPNHAVMAADLPGVAALEPVIRVLDLPAVLEPLPEEPIVVVQAITERGVVESRQ